MLKLNILVRKLVLYRRKIIQKDILGLEEHYGYRNGSFVRDNAAANAALLI